MGRNSLEECHLDVNVILIIGLQEVTERIADVPRNEIHFAQGQSYMYIVLFI